jgi:hypothetical protein
METDELALKFSKGGVEEQMIWQWQLNSMV